MSGAAPVADRDHALGIDRVHSILGVVYAMSGKSNTSRYAYQDNWRYTLQRVSTSASRSFSTTLRRCGGVGSSWCPADAMEPPLLGPYSGGALAAAEGMTA